MAGSTHISMRARNVIVVLLALMYLSICVRTVLHTRPWIGRPFPGFLLLGNNFVPVVYMPQWEGIKQGVKVGDVLTQVNGVAVSRSKEVRNMVLAAPAGTVFTYRFIRNGQPFERSIPTSLFPFGDYIIIHAIWFSIGLSFLLMALTVFYLKPNGRAPRAFLLVGLVSAFSQAPTPDYCISNQSFLTLILLHLLGPTIIILSLYFPLELQRRKPVIVALALITALIVAANLYYFDAVFTFILFDNLFLAWLVLTFSLGIVIMVRSFVQSPDALVHQKAKIVIYGFVVASVFGGLGLFASLALKVMNFAWVFIPIALVPLSVAYAIGKHNLFDVDVLIRRSLSYILVSALAVTATLALLNAIKFALQSATGQSAEIASVITILVMVVLFRPVRDRVDRMIERRFFGERLASQHAIRKAANVLNNIMALSELTRRILDTVMDAFKIERGVLLLQDQEQKSLRPAQLRDPSEQLPEPSFLPLDHPICRRLEQGGQALQISALENSEALRDRAPMLEAMRGLGAALLIPIMYERRLIGALALGPRPTGALFSTEDVDLLQTLMIQTAVSIENAAKVEELKRMVAIETSYHELKKLDEMKDNFLAMVSHDLRTPLTGINAYAAIMRERAGTLAVEDQIKYLDIIIGQGERLTALINDLLDVQRFEAGRMSLEMTDLNLAELVVKSVDAFAGACERKGIRLEKDLPAEGTIVTGHEGRLEQVMANLLGNAVKFTPENGRILVSLTTAHQGGPGAAARVCVKDSGPGISSEDQARLFEKFEQASRPVRGRPQGSGLGLALARQIVEYHNGRIGVQSQPGMGSEFFFLLPLAPARTA